jgi:hypothetical protein
MIGGNLVLYHGLTKNTKLFFRLSFFMEKGGAIGFSNGS